MKSCSKLVMAAAVIAVPLALLSGCDRSDPTAPSMSKVLVEANPTHLRLAEGVAGTSTITATVVDNDGVPVSGIAVHFTTDFGSLRSNGSSIKTNSDGIARDILTVHGGDDDATVKARAAGATEGTVTVSLGANAAPVAEISPASISTSLNTSFTVNGSSSHDSDGNIVRYDWDWGDGTAPDENKTTSSQSHTYTTAAGSPFTITLKVYDDGVGAMNCDSTTHLCDGYKTGTKTITATIGNQAPDGTIDMPTDNVAITAGQSVTFAGTGTDPDHNEPLTFLWTFGNGGPASSTLEDPGPVQFNTAATYTVTFTVKDSRGLADPTPPTRVITVN